MKKIVVFSLLLALACLWVNGQNNVIKANLTRLMTLKAEVAYERAFLKKFSSQTTFTYQIPSSKIPGTGKMFTDAFENSGIYDAKYNAYWITQDFRFYLSPIKESPKGIYLSLFGRYSNRILNMVFIDTLNNGRTFKTDGRININGIGGGIMLGHQWIIANRLSLDLYIIGLGYNKHTFKLKASSDEFTEQEVRDAADEFNREVENAEDRPKWFSKPEATADGKTLIVKSNFLFPIIRSLGFNIGFAF